MIRRLFILLMIPLYCTLAAAQGKLLVINELMQSNVDYLMVDHDSPITKHQTPNALQRGLNIIRYSNGTRRKAILNVFCHRNT